MTEWNGRRRVRANEAEERSRLHGDSLRDVPSTASYSTSDAVKRFKEMMKIKYGKDLTEYEAGQQLDRLANFFQTLHEIDIANKRRKAESAPAIASTGRKRVTANPKL